MTIAEALAFGLQYHQKGDLQRAEALYRQILQVDTSHAEALHLLGVIAHQHGQHETAIACMTHSVRLQPHNASLHCNLGLAYMALGKIDAAVACYQTALQLQPDNADAHNNLGIAFEQQDKLREALACYRQARALKPAHAEACYNLGNVLRRLGELGEAVDCYREACRLKPNYAKALNNLGIAFRQQGNLAEAVACWQQAVEMPPGLPDACNNLGEAYFTQGQLDQAVKCFQQALQLQPTLLAAQSNVLFCLNYDPNADPDAVFAEHRFWGQNVEAAVTRQPHANDRDGERRLRIGYVSGDLCDHAVARYLAPVLACHDPKQVEVFCYAQVAAPDTVTARLQKLVQQWRWTCHLSDGQLAEQIRQDRIDILVDLAGHTAHNRLGALAHKPAPVQATWLGYLNTTGLTAIDYRLTDDVLDPLGQPVRDTEELIRLPGGMCCFEPPEWSPAVGPLPALRCGQLTLGSLNRVSKLNDRVFDLWAQVLTAIATARLLIYHDHLTPSAQDNVRTQFVKRGIAAERLELRQGAKSVSYLEVYGDIDICLDTFPCTGGVTTCESLWMGVPVLSLSGERPASRHSASLLTRVGLAEWAVSTSQQYVALAVKMSQDLQKLPAIRAQLRERMRETVCNGRRFTQALEAAYRTMWHRWRGQGPM